MKKAKLISILAILMIAANLLAGCRTGTEPDGTAAATTKPLAADTTKAPVSTTQAPETTAASEQNPEPALRQDAYELISVLESTHPAFALNDVPEDYERAKQEYIDAVTEETSTYEFALLTKKFLTVLRDGHTQAAMSFVDTMKLDMRTLAVFWRAVGDELFLLDEKGRLSHRVTHIGGVPVAAVFETISAYSVAENDTARDWNNSIQSVYAFVL